MSRRNGTDEPPRSAGHRYLDTLQGLLDRLEGETWPAIDAAAALVTEALATGHDLHAFGSGHSHMLAEELFYRAGGLVRVRPILFEGLMLHASAPLSTALERLPGLAAALHDDHPMQAGDVLLIASNSGGNAVTVELARLARAEGVGVIAITSLHHATSTESRTPGTPRLHEVADVVIDNGGVVGDASVAVAGLASRVAPTSTVLGAAIVNTLVAEVAERLVARGVVPDVFTSGNVAGGDAANGRLLRAAIR